MVKKRGPKKTAKNNGKRRKWRTYEKPAPNGVKMFDRRLDLINEKICEECKSPLTISTIPIIQNEGVGQTYAQEHIRSFSIQYDIVCSKCGLVARAR